MTLLEKIKTRIYLKFCARKIYTAMVDTDKAITKKIAGIYLDDYEITSGPRVYVYQNYIYIICGLHVQSDLTNHSFDTSVGYYIPKDQVLNYRKYLIYVQLLGDSNLIRERPQGEQWKRTSL
jgi:hypothetical protein